MAIAVDKMTTFSLLFASIILISIAAASDDSGKVTNGVVATVGEFPYVVSIGEVKYFQSKQVLVLRFKKNLNYIQAHLCGGYIYNAMHVITAASCVYK